MSRIHSLLLILSICLVAPAGAAASPGEMTHFPLPAGSGPHGIAAGPDGNLWFTESGTNMIGRISPSGELREFPVPTPGAEPFEIAAGPDGNLWFTESAARKIGRITPDGRVSEFPLPEWDCGGACRPWGIVAGPDGNVWFTAAGMFGAIGRVSPVGEITMFRSGGESRGIAVGPDGNPWVAEVVYEHEEPSYGQVARVSVDGSVTTFPLLRRFREFPTDIALGPDGDLWFVGGGVGHIDTNGRVSILDVPLPGFPIPAGGLGGIVSGPEGSLWFGSGGVVSSEGAIIRLTPDGRASHFRIGDSPGGLAVGPDGNVWFTESARPGIGRVTPGLAGVEISSSRASVRGRLTRIALACSGGGPGGRCRGMVKLVACLGALAPEGHCRGVAVELARAGYDLWSGQRGSLRLRLTVRAGELLDGRRELLVKAVARPSRGEGMTRPLTLRRRPGHRHGHGRSRGFEHACLC